MRVVVSVGGNALLKRGEAMTASAQRANAMEAACALASVLAHHEVLITHGNGPQVGLLALQAQSDKSLPAYPFDILGAESQAMVGYILLEALQKAMPSRRFVNLVTRTLVDQADPAFDKPTKFIGPVYEKEQALELAKLCHWHVLPDGRYWRRVVASPAPCEVLELEAIESLMQAGFTVIAAGGGGVPVVREGKGFRGVEAVIDKDLTASLLSQALHAERFVIATDVDAVYENFDELEHRPIGRICASELEKGLFPAGSMGPKVKAACEFVKRTGRCAAIGALGDIAGLIELKAGTVIEP